VLELAVELVELELADVAAAVDPAAGAVAVTPPGALGLAGAEPGAEVLPPVAMVSKDFLGLSPTWAEKGWAGATRAEVGETE
jgi:hypothetical protein